MVIGRRLAELGALGRFAVDFVVVQDNTGAWTPYAIELNLRKGGTTHPFLTLQFLTDGYKADPVDVLGDALFEETYDEMVLVRDIEFYSLCEHHMLLFLGRAHVAYLPKGKVIGLSKIPRIVDMYARRLQVQERMTRQIADLLQQTLERAIDEFDVPLENLGGHYNYATTGCPGKNLRRYLEDGTFKRMVQERLKR